MPARRARTPYDMPPEVRAVIGALATVPDPWAPADTRPGPKANAYRLRQDIYRWRRNTLDALNPYASASDEERKALRDHLSLAFGPRLAFPWTVQWLELATFRVEEVEGGWIVRGQLRVPLAGDIPTFEPPRGVGAGWGQRGGAGRGGGGMEGGVPYS